MTNSFSNQDSFDIQELATLNEDISIDFIEQLQNQVAQNASQFSGKNNDGELFEEIPEKEEQVQDIPEGKPDSENLNEQENAEQQVSEVSDNQKKANLDDSFDDNFIKKYKAKLNKQQGVADEVADETSTQQNEISDTNSNDEKQSIAKLTSGNIVEKPVAQEQISYNDSLDYLDENIKYSKYVIYIDPENTEFIESLTVKERKNLINKILREQDDIAITKKRFSTLQAVIKHSIVAILTIAVSIPIIYYTINASLEASINNYRNSQTNFQTLYREKGKIKTTAQTR